MTGRKILILCALLATFVAQAEPANANIYPPTPTRHFYGDANGDAGVTGLDLMQHGNYVLHKSYSYDTLQPQTSSQSWNTCDIDSDRGCTSGDLEQLTNYILHKQVTINDKLWHLHNFNLSETGNSSGVWIPFSANLYSTHSTLGESGRAGISVVAEIDATGSTITGELSGRTCSPAAGSRDQAALAGAQCALAVTVTDWTTPGQGLTEAGAYGLQIKADGEGSIKLNLFISAIPGLDVPAVTTSVVVNFAADQLDIECPTLNEDYTGWCWLNLATGPGTCAVGPNDTCGGFTYPGCNGYSLPVMGEAAGPGTCIAEIVKGGAVDTNIVTILEVNQPPAIGISCPPSASESSPAVCSITVSDADLPAQQLTCLLDPSTTCTGATVTGCSQVDIPAQGLSQSSCIVAVDVADDFSPPGTNSASTTIIITPPNNPPAISVNCPSSVVDSSPAVCSITASDPDVPPQQLACSLNPSTTCTGATVTGCNHVDVPAQGLSQSSCIVTVDVADDYFPPGTNSGSDTINILPNTPPAITVNCPASIGENVATTCPFTVSDPDVPPQTLTCTKNAATTCTSVYITNCVGTTVPTQGELAGGTSCNVVVDISDGAGGNGQGSDTISITETNQNPTISMTCPSSVNETDSASCAITSVSDADIPVQTLTCLIDSTTTCAGVVLNGCSSVDIPVQGEAKGPGSCVVAVKAQDDFAPPGSATASKTITINEVNQPPTITVDCPANVGENASTSCALTVSDPDLPAQTLTCSLEAATTCRNTTISGCVSVAVPAQGETAGGSSCNVVVKVKDSYNATATQSDTIIIDEINLPPYWVIAPTDLNVEVDQIVARYSGYAADPDFMGPPEGPGSTVYLTCSKVSQDCSFDVTITGAADGGLPCEVSFTAAPSPETCNVGVRVTDGWGAMIEGSFQIIVSDTHATWYVDADATGANTGASWSDAFTTLQDAADAALATDQIWVAEGVYYRPSTADPTDPVLVMKDGVDMYGGFIGTETMLSEREDPALHPTILDGEKSSNHVVIGNSDALLNGFKIIGGSASSLNGGPYVKDGGGMLNIILTDLTIEQCVFDRNLAYKGGAIRNYKTSLTINDCEFSENNGVWGGAINNSYSAATINNCIFKKNMAADGGAIYNVANTSVEISRSVFVGNGDDYADGSAIYNYWHSAPIITNCTFFDNYSYDGGAIYNDTDSPIITNSILRNNGSEIVDVNSTSTVTYSDVEGDYTGIGNIHTEPMFISTPEFNFHLQPGSPCINAGDPDPIYNDPDGSRNDMGAYGGPGSYFDSDYDGMEDWWEALYLLNPNDPSDAVLDPDNDTYTNLQEFNFNLNPQVTDIWYVDPDATGAGTGRSWADAFNNIQEAVDPIRITGMVWVAEGVYTRPSGATTSESILIMKDGARIYGGFAGTETSLAERGAPSAHPTILDGEGTSLPVVFGASMAKLDGVTVANGALGMASRFVTGLEIFDCIFRDNIDVYPYEGGGMVNFLSSVSLRNCLFTGNDGGWPYGADINNTHSTLTIINCTLSSSGLEMGLLNNDYNSTTTIMNSILWSDAYSNANLIENLSGTVTVSYSDIEGGWAGTGNINTDPMFISASEGNYHLDPTSPCRDTGDPDPAYNDPDGTRNDMGVYGGPGSHFDSDYDGMEDWWELLYGFNPDDPSDAALDPDNDTFTNLQEFTFGLNPLVADIWYVDADATGAGTGTSWADAFNNVQEAVDAISGLGAIWVAEGTYTRPTAAEPTDSVLVMKSGVRLYGGFAGTENTLAERSDPSTHQTILDGEGTSYHVVVGASNAVLDGFTITRGYSQETSASLDGAGMYNYYVENLEINNCKFVNNQAWNVGGGIYNYASSPTMNNCLIAYNKGPYYRDLKSGVGMANDFYSSPTLNHCSFIGNQDQSTWQGGGGGMLNSDHSSPIITNCKFFDNHTGGKGGAILNTDFSAPLIRNCVFFDNMAMEGTGVADENSSSSIIVNCTFHRNGYGSSTVQNSSGSSLYMTNSIVWGNAPYHSMGGIGYQSPFIPTISYSDVQNWSLGENNVDVDPMFVAREEQNLMLQEFSPCRNLGNPDPAFNNPDNSRNDMGAFGGPGGELDSDFDGMTDQWENAWGFSPADPSDAIEDLDGDTYSNREEYSFGLDPTFSDIWYIDIDATGASTGRSWTDAFNNVQYAINKIEGAGTVWVAEGTYTAPLDLTAEEVVIMRGRTRLYGGFIGTESNLSERGDPFLHETTLDGEDIRYTVVVGANHGILDGFTIARGRETGTTWPRGDGAGLRISTSWDFNEFAVTNCKFMDNYAVRNGGAISSTCWALTIDNCIFDGNSSGDDGAAFSGSATITNSIFSGNSTDGNGGAIGNGNPLEISNCAFFGNYAAVNGGAIYAQHSSQTITNCAFSGNTAESSGGAIYFESSSVLLSNCIMWGDLASTGNEIYTYVGYSTPTVIYSDIMGGWPGTGNIDADPLFVGYPDLHLQSGSPCINAGTSTGAPLFDLDGNPRPSPLGGAFDMGAYEYQWP